VGLSPANANAVLIKTDTGMPQEWQKLLDDNGITRAEQEQNPDQVS